MLAINVHGPHARQWDTPVGLGTSSHGGTSAATVDTFQGHGDKDDKEDDEEVEERGYDELAESQLQVAPSTQPTQVAGRRRRCPPYTYTPGTDAFGHKGKGKTRRR